MASEPTAPVRCNTGRCVLWRTFWTDDNGTRRSKSFGRADKTTRSHAVSRFKSWLPQWRVTAAIQSPQDSYTVTDLCNMYLKHAEVYYRRDGNPTGEATNIFYALRPWFELVGEIPADVLKPCHLKAFQQMLIDKGTARTTINKRVNIIRRWAKWCVSEQLMPASTLHTFQSVEGLKKNRSEAKEAKPIRAIDSQTLNRTLKHSPTTIQTMIRLEWLTGMRPAEVCRMRAVDIDTSDEPWSYKPEHHKTEHHGHERRIYLGPEARELIRPFRPNRPLNAPLFSPADAIEQRRGRRPQRRINGQYTTRGYRRAIHYACDRAGVPRWSPNQVRHAFEQRTERQYGIDKARAAMGQVSVDSTKVYGDRDHATARMIAEKVG